MLNLEAILNTEMQEVPYNWALIKNLLSDEASLELANSYPSDEFQVSEGEGYGYLWGKIIVSEKDVSSMLQSNDDRWRLRISKERMTSNLEHLSDAWQELIEQLWTDAYREALEEMSGVKLKNCFMDIAFRRYKSGHKHHPHTDEPNKVLTHLLFFNQEWSTDWGGCLRILKDSQPESCFQDILPLNNSSVVIVRSHNSWHTVTPLNSPSERLALRVAFFTDAD